MSRFATRLPDLVIQNGGTDSNTLNLTSIGQLIDRLLINIDANLAETVNIMVSSDGRVSFFKLAANPITAITIAAGQAGFAVLLAGNFGLGGLITHLKLTATGAVAATRTFQASFSETI